jgi:hypothetical protein
MQGGARSTQKLAGFQGNARGTKATPAFLPDAGAAHRVPGHLRAGHRPATRLAYEFPLFGDFAADIILGNAEVGEYCLVELEDASESSILKKVKGKATKEWSPRFDHGCSQLIDWFYALDDMKKTSAFTKHFGHGHIKFFGLLLIGRSAGLSADDLTRLKWRTEKVLVDSHPLFCLTFDALYQHLARRIDFYPEAARLDK